MVLPRFTAFRGALGQLTSRRIGAQARSRAWRQIGQRTYASGHGAEKSSDIPWMIGSIVVTVPAASWLWSQGPAGGGHGGHDGHEKHEEHEEKAEEEEPEEKEDDGDEKSDDSDSDKDDSKDTPATSDDDEGGDDKEEEKKDGPSSGSPGQINQNDKKGPGEQQKEKGSREKTETAGEKQAASHYSGAKHPYLDDDEKSKKGEGVTETAKIHGTVQSDRDAR